MTDKLGWRLNYCQKLDLDIHVHLLSVICAGLSNCWECTTARISSGKNRTTLNNKKSEICYSNSSINFHYKANESEIHYHFLFSIFHSKNTLKYPWLSLLTDCFCPFWRLNTSMSCLVLQRWKRSSNCPLDSTDTCLVIIMSRLMATLCTSLIWNNQNSKSIQLQRRPQDNNLPWGSQTDGSAPPTFRYFSHDWLCITAKPNQHLGSLVMQDCWAPKWLSCFWITSFFNIPFEYCFNVDTTQYEVAEAGLGFKWGRHVKGSFTVCNTEAW